LHGVARFRFDPWDYQVLAVPQILGCALCGTPAARTIDVNATTSPLLTYERMVTFPPRAYLDVKTHQRHYLQSNVQMQHERQQFPDTSCRPLPDVDPLAAMGTVTLAQALDGAIPSRATSENTADLASLLRLTFGMRPAWDNGDPVSRWVANGANMGSPQCYLAVGHHVEGVERGVYAYDAAAHGLCCLPADPDQLFAAVPHSSGDRAAGSTNALIVMTGALERLARKYESFAYRVIFLDAGCVLAQLRVAGASMGVRIAAASRWDDEAIARALNTDPEGEPITAAAWLSFPTNEGHGASR
jgi:SagB-type dehydrogenase family enzyme